MAPALLLELELVEEGIAVDPKHRLHRRERADGSIVDMSAIGVGLLPAYEMDEDGLPTMLELRNLTRY